MTINLKLYEHCKYFRTPKHTIMKSTYQYSAFLIFFCYKLYMDRTNTPTIMSMYHLKVYECLYYYS